MRQRSLVTNSGIPYRERPARMVVGLSAALAVLVAGATLRADWPISAGPDAIWIGLAIAVAHATVYLARIEADSHMFSGEEIPILSAAMVTPDQLGPALVVTAFLLPMLRRRLAMLGRMRTASWMKVTHNVSGVVLGGFAALHLSRAAMSLELSPVLVGALAGAAYFAATLATATAIMVAARGGSPATVIVDTARRALPATSLVTIVGLGLAVAVRDVGAPGPTILIVTVGLYFLARARMRTWRAAEAGDRILRAVPEVLGGGGDLDAATLETARRLLGCREARISTSPAGPGEMGVPLDQGPERMHLVVGDRIGEHRTFDVEDLVLLENLATLVTAARAHRWTVDQLRRSEETRAAIAGALGHDLRAPLALVASGLSTLREHRERLDPHTTAELLLRAEEQAHRVTTILDDLLALERLTTDPLTTIPGDVDRAVAATVRAHDGAVTSRPGPPVTVRLDQRIIERILDNLVGNARKHAPGTPITIAWQREGPDVVITVDDGGSGIPQHLRDRLTEPFRQGDPRTSGVGLGLHLARRFTELAGGRLEIRDATGGGASVRAVLPAATSADEEVRTAGAVSRGSAPSSP